MHGKGITDTFAKKQINIYYMTFEQAQEKALQYAKENGYSTIRNAGERDGYWYFHLIRPPKYGHYLGLPQYVKISQTTDNVSRSEGWEEAMWASKQECILNNL